MTTATDLTTPPSVPHPVYGQNWTCGGDADPASLPVDDPRRGDEAELVVDCDPAVYDAVAEAAPAEGLTFDGFWNLAVSRYLAAMGLTWSRLHDLAARAYLAEIGRPVAGGGEPDA